MSMPKSEFCLRWGNKKDSRAIGVLEARSQLLEGRSTPCCDAKELSMLWNIRFEKGAKVILALHEQSSQLAGFLSFKGELSQGNIQALYIEPKWIRRKVGSLLLRTAAALCVLRGGSSLQVAVLTHNLRARNFYTSLHFRATGVKSSHLIYKQKEL